MTYFELWDHLVSQEWLKLDTCNFVYTQSGAPTKTMQKPAIEGPERNHATYSPFNYWTRTYLRNGWNYRVLCEQCVQPLPNYFGLLLLLFVNINKNYMLYNLKVYNTINDKHNKHSAYKILTTKWQR